MQSNRGISHYPRDKFFQNLLSCPVNSDLSNELCHPPFEQLGPAGLGANNKLVSLWPLFCLKPLRAGVEGSLRLSASSQKCLLMWTI